MATLAEMRQKQLARTQGSSFFDPAEFPFWNLDFDSSSIVRFVAWDDPISNGYWTEKKMIPMKFRHPDDDSKFVYYYAPSRRMYGEKCKATQLVSDMFNEAKDLEKAGRDNEAKAIRAKAGPH